MKRSFFDYAKKEEGCSLAIFQIKKLCDFLDSVNFFLIETKKSTLDGKKPKGRPSKATKNAEKLEICKETGKQGENQDFR